MLERGSGAIVNIASRLGQMGIAETAAYSAAKAGLIGLTRSLAREFGPRGHPRQRRRARAHRHRHDRPTSSTATRAGAGCATCRSAGSAGADEVADAVIFLLSDRAERCSSARRSTPTPAATCRDEAMP